MASRTYFQTAPFIILAVILISCAGQVPPGGGPVDTIPPTIIRTEPDTNALGVQTARIVLEFSEYVDRRSVEESIFISPYVGDLEFDWSGTEVTLTFSRELRKNTTYVVNIGTDVVDIRAHNRMAKGYTLAFSTGEIIDRGMIKGRVFDEKPEGVMMFAYSLNGILPDTLNPGVAKPDYIMQTGKDGTFVLSNMGWGTYRIFAVRDEYRNFIYDKQIDQFGVATHDVRIDSVKPQVDNLWFQLSREDTSKPFLTKVQALSRRQLLLRFSEPLDTASFTRSRMTLEDTTNHGAIGIILRSLARSDSTVATVLTDVPLDSGKIFRLTVSHVLDLAGNPIDSAHSGYVFDGTNIPDTVRPAVFVAGLADSTREILLEQSFEIRFSEPVVQLPLFNGVTLVDSTRKKVDATIQWLSADGMLLKPRQPLDSKAWYAIRIVMDSVRDFAGNTYRDSVRVTRFQTLDLRTTGTVEGMVTDADTGRNIGTIFLSAIKILSPPVYEQTVRLRTPGKFKFEKLPEGRYIIKVFRDRDSSLTYSFGRPFPFQPSERFSVYADTVKVRARWGVEGVTINLKAEGGR